VLPLANVDGCSIETEVAPPQLVDPFSPGWNDSLAEYSQATIFHTTEWARVLADTYGYEPCFFRWQDARGSKLLCLFEVNSWLTGRRAVSAPFADFAPALGFEQSVELKNALQRLQKVGQEKRWKRIEVRGAPSDWTANSSSSFFTHELNLREPIATLHRNCCESTRRAVRKAERSGVSVEISDDIRAVEEYFELHCLTRKKHGLPPQSLGFFQNIHRHIIANGLGFTALAKLKGQNLAGAIFFNFQGRSLYKFGASNPITDSYRPSNLVMWRGIEQLAGQRAKSLSFGRTDLHQEGLRRYKLGWGAKEERIQYLNFDPKNETFLNGKNVTRSNRLFGFLPIAVLKRIGAILYPHLG